METIIEVSELGVLYDGSRALDRVSFTVSPGDCVGIVGPNGGGKTTLVKAILGLIPIGSGSIRLFGTPLTSFRDYHRIGYLPQYHTLSSLHFPISVTEIVGHGLVNSPYPTGHRHDLIIHALEMFQIAHLSDHTFAELSGGQRQKVLLARSLVSRPSLLILDEPSTALDTASRATFLTHLERLRDDTGTTILLITHDTGYVGSFAQKIMYVDRTVQFYGDIKTYCQSDDVSACFERTDHHLIWHQHS